MTPRAFTLPDLGEGLTEGEVARWLVAEGDTVAEDDLLVEISTDKATVEIPSPYAGTVLGILVAEGEVVPVGTALVVIGEPGESVAGFAAPDSPTQTGLADSSSHSAEGRVAATPLVRRVAQELGVDLASITGTGPEGRITEEDVRARVGGEASVGEGRRVRLRGIRRRIAEHMTVAHREVPSVTWVEECEFETVALEQLVASVVKACALSLSGFPELNARLEGDEIVLLDRYDLGVAMQTDDGLVVPVVRGCDALSLEEIHAEIMRLGDGARSSSLLPEELRGSTFTVTSAGKLAGLFQTPIVNHPEVAILSIGRIAPRAVVRDGDVVVRRTGSLALTFDHRVVDGARAAGFGLDVIERLQSAPTSLA